MDTWVWMSLVFEVDLLVLNLLLLVIFAFPSPHPPPSSGDWSGGVGEDCLSTWTRSGSCEFVRKPDQPSNAGNPEGMVDWGRLFLGYFLFGEAKESD